MLPERIEALQKTLKLMQEHPNYPVVCWVNGEVVVEPDGGRWMGEITDAYIEEACFYNDRWYTDRKELEEDYYDYNYDDIAEKVCGLADDVDDQDALIDAICKEATKDWFHSFIAIDVDIPEPCGELFTNHKKYDEGIDEATEKVTVGKID